MPTFRDEFARTPAGPARENLIFQEAIKMGPPKTVPVTINGPSGTKITYQVMPDFLMIDGIRVPMSGITAQKIADHFNMKLPTAKMSLQIYDAAKKSGNALVAKPLSGTGATINGKHYSGQDVVNKGVDKSEFSIAYNDNINQEELVKNQNPNKPTLIDGHMKTILQPIAGKLGLHGLYDANGKPIQGGSGETPHDINHSEYAAGARLISNDVLVTMPDGKITKTTMDKIMSLPQLSKTVSYSKGVETYNKPSTYKAIHQAGPPAGYTSAVFPTPEIRAQVQNIAKGMLSKEMWSEIPFEVEGNKYLAKIEPHSNAPKGVSVYEIGHQPSKGIAKAIPVVSKRMTLLDKINDLLDKF